MTKNRYFHLRLEFLRWKFVPGLMNDMMSIYAGYSCGSDKFCARQMNIQKSFKRTKKAKRMLVINSDMVYALWCWMIWQNKEVVSIVTLTLSVLSSLWSIVYGFFSCATQKCVKEALEGLAKSLSSWYMAWWILMCPKLTCPYMHTVMQHWKG